MTDRDLGRQDIPKKHWRIPGWLAMPTAAGLAIFLANCGGGSAQKSPEAQDTSRVSVASKDCDPDTYYAQQNIPRIVSRGVDVPDEAVEIGKKQSACGNLTRADIAYIKLFNAYTELSNRPAGATATVQAQQKRAGEVQPTPVAKAKTPEQELKEQVDRKFAQAQVVAKQWLDLLLAGNIGEVQKLQLHRPHYFGDPIFPESWPYHPSGSQDYLKKCSIDLKKGEFKWLKSTPHSTSVKLTPPRNEAERLNRERGLDREITLVGYPNEERYTISIDSLYRFPVDGWGSDRRDQFRQYNGVITLHDVTGKFFIVSVNKFCAPQ